MSTRTPPPRPHTFFVALGDGVSFYLSIFGGSLSKKYYVCISSLDVCVRDRGTVIDKRKTNCNEYAQNITTVAVQYSSSSQSVSQTLSVTSHESHVSQDGADVVGRAEALGAIAALRR